MQLVFFDLDGTITRRDTLTPYVLGFALRRPWRLPGLLRVLPTLIRFLLGRADHGALKGSLIQAALGGATRAQLAQWNESFLPRLRSRGIFADALQAIELHRRQHDRLILMSASVDLYVPQLARELGFDACICSGVRWDGDRLLGTLSTANCRGEEKVRQLRAEAALHPQLTTVAYGNSRPDLPHLLLAQRGFIVNPSASLWRDAAERGLTRLSWS